MRYELRITGKFYQQLKQHLFPKDSKEAAAILLCGRHETKDISISLSHKILLIPYDECRRKRLYNVENR